jgi:hypothetical protein
MGDDGAFWAYMPKGFLLGDDLKYPFPFGAD